MTVNVNLDEALDQPLFEGPLQLFRPDGLESANLDLSDLLESERVPIVTVGMPRAWPVEELVPTLLVGKTMKATSPVIGPDERALLLRLACSFRPRTEQTQVSWAALLLFLWVGSGALRRVRGRSSQVKGACGVAARVRFAPP
jgi:hypothetical protein